MPQPIIPIHQQENMPITFGESILPGFQLSELQQVLLQSTATKPEVKRYSHNTMDALVKIDQNPDLVVTAVSTSNDRYCAVPPDINDHTLLMLKAEGLVSGAGRSVVITDRGRTILRDKYLQSNNALKENRKSEMFDYRSFSRIAFKKEKTD